MKLLQALGDDKYLASLFNTIPLIDLFYIKSLDFDLFTERLYINLQAELIPDNIPLKDKKYPFNFSSILIQFSFIEEFRFVQPPESEVRLNFSFDDINKTITGTLGDLIIVQFKFGFVRLEKWNLFWKEK